MADWGAFRIGPPTPRETRHDFVRATRDDTAAAADLYRRIRAHLAANIDYPRWVDEGRPAPDTVAAWIVAGELFIAFDGEQCVGVVALNHAAPQGYADAAWAVEAEPEEVLLIHALGVDPERPRQGIARFLVDGALAVAREMGCRAVRLDTYVDNAPARELYARHGFTNLGLHTLDYGVADLTQFHLFEYVLD